MPSTGPRAAIASLLAALALATTLVVPAAAQAPTPGSTPGSSPTALATPVLSVRRAPEFLRSQAIDAAVEQQVAPVLADVPEQSCLAITDHGRDVTGVRRDLPLIPASVNKLLTTDAAVAVLGPTATLDTVVRADAAPGPDGVVAGNLYLVGGGDPLLFTEGFRVTLKDEDQIQTDFAAVADAVAAAGITEVRGGIVGDESRYDAERGIPTWSSNYQAEGAAGALSALEVNRGQTGLSQDPDTPARVRKLGDPPTLAAETLASLLADRGVSVSGPPTAGTAPAASVEVARVPSVPIEDLAAEILTWSDNTAAELLTKEVGRASSGSGTTTAGVTAIQQNLAAQGLPMAGVTMTDGSGLDRGNRVTCELVVDLLDRQGPDSALAEGLSVAGESGTLRDRLRGSALAGRLRAKTGTLSEVNALAGFVTTDDGRELTFAMIVNDDEEEGYQRLDELALALLSATDAPAVEVLGPR